MSQRGCLVLLLARLTSCCVASASMEMSSSWPSPGNGSSSSCAWSASVNVMESWLEDNESEQKGQHTQRDARPQPQLHIRLLSLVLCSVQVALACSRVLLCADRALILLAGTVVCSLTFAGSTSLTVALSASSSRYVAFLCSMRHTPRSKMDCVGNAKGVGGCSTRLLEACAAQSARERSEGRAGQRPFLLCLRASAALRPCPWRALTTCVRYLRAPLAACALCA